MPGDERQETNRPLIRRTSKIALEVVGVAVAATALLLAVLAWRLSSGPISLPILSQIIEDSARSQLAGGRLDIGDTILIWSAQDRQLGLRLRDVRLTGADGNRVAAAPELSFRLSVPALLIGRLAPTSVDFYGINATIVRRPGVGISLGLASAGEKPNPASEASAMIGPMLSALATGETENSILGYLRHVGIRDATLNFVDEVNGVSFEAPNANLALFRGGGGVAGSLSADLALGDTKGHIELSGALPQGASSIQLGMRATGIVPAALARASPSLANYALFDAPIDADGNLELARDGTVKSGRLSLDAGKGTFTLPGLEQAPVPIEKAHAELTLDAAANRLDLAKLVFQAGPHSISMQGHVDYTLGAGVNISTARIELSAGKTTTEIPGFFEGPVEFDNVHVAALLDFDKRSMTVEDIKLGVGGGRIAASGKLEEGARSPAISFKGTIESVPIATARTVWPLVLSDHAREWVSEHMKGGTLRSANFNVNFAANVIEDTPPHAPLPAGSVHFEFNVDGTTVSYLDAMPPLENVTARGLVQPNRFDAWVSSAIVNVAPGKTLAVSNGHFADGDIANPHSIGDIEFTGAGATADILALLDHEPLKLIRGFGLDPSTVGGTGTLSAALRLPLVKTVKISDVDFSGKAHADKISIPHLDKNMSITSGTLDVDVTRQGLKSKGIVSFNNSTPLGILWTESFNAGSGPSSSYRMTGDFDAAARASIGLDFEKYLTGPVVIDAKLTGKGAAISGVDLHADLAPAVLNVTELGWTKPAGKSVTVDLKLAITKDAYAATNMKAAGEGVDVRGAFTAANDGRIMLADFPTLKLGPDNDLVAHVRRDDRGQLLVALKGAKYDARGILHDFISGNGDKKEAEEAATRVLTPEMEQDPTRRTQISAVFDEVAAQNGTKLSHVDGRFTLIDGSVYLMELGGTDQGGLPLAATIRGQSERTRRFSMTSNDAGLVFRSLDLFNSIVGGTFAANATIDDKLPGSPMNGEITVGEFRIVKAPVLASMLSLGSLTGIRDTLTGEGIFFDSLKLPFRVTGHRIHVEEARMSGPAIGLTMNGQIDRSMNVTDMEGTLVPAYTINSVLGNVPLLGPLLVGRKGEGIFGFTYAVKGNTDKPSVIVNPLSAIAPGFLRRLFEFSSSLPPETPAVAPAASGKSAVPLPEAAPAPAPAKP
jgi:hypothetical protein